jgi:hypothetical protein
MILIIGIKSPGRKRLVGRIRIFRLIGFRNSKVFMKETLLYDNIGGEIK